MIDKMKEVIQNRSFEEFPCKWSHPITFGNPSPPEDENAEKRCAFVRGMNWYRNNVWHPASEKPAGVDDAGRDIHIVTMGPEYYGNKLQTWHIFSYMSWEWVKLHAGEFDKWAYLEDLLPDKNI